MHRPVVLLASLLALLAPLSGASDVCGIDKTPINKISQFEALAAKVLAQSDSSCPAQLRLAVEELKDVTHNEDVCSQKKANKIRSFHTKYLIEKQVALPKAIERYFVAFALEVSAICRTELIRILNKSSSEKLNRKDWKAVDKFVSKDGLLAVVINEPEDYDDLIPPKALLSVLNQDGEQAVKKEKVFLQISTVGTIREVQAMCRQRFTPLYESLVLPITTLSSLGYNYKFRPREERAKELSEISESTLRWYRLIYLCETLGNIEVIELAERDLSRPYAPTKIMTREDAEKLRETSPELFKNGQTDDYPLVAGVKVRVSLVDQFYGLDDKRFVKAIDHFKAKPGLISRFFERIVESLKDKLRRSAAKYALAKQNIELGNTKVRDTEEFINVLDDYVYQYRFKDFPKEKREKRMSQGVFNFLMNTLISTLFIAIVFGGAALAIHFMGPGR